MLIKIDCREKELFSKCQLLIDAFPKYKDIKLISQSLPLGDIIINDGTNDCIIIERKTLADLAASIKDGRYEEQSYRLNGLQHHNHNIIYLIEGDMNRFNTFKERVDKQTLYSAMVSIHYFKGFSVMRSNNIEETAVIACNMVYKLVGGLKASKIAFYSNTITVTNNTDTTNNVNNVDNVNNVVLDCNEKTEETDNNAIASEKDYCTVVKKNKKENITPNNIGEIMLCQLPGISSASALAILETFKTLPNLIQSIKEDNNCLNNIYITDANGKKRKLSKTVITTILTFLCSPKNDN